MIPRRYNRRTYAAILYRVLVDEIPVKEVAREFGFSNRKTIDHIVERYSVVFHEKRSGELWGINFVDLKSRRH